MKRTLVAATALAAVLPLAACGGSSSSSTSSSSTTTATGTAPASSSDASGASTAPAGSTTITVLAAASLKESFDEIAANYQKAHPGTTVKISYGGSSALAQQIVQGSPVDLFAAASTTTMETATTSGRMESPVTFATNSLEIAVPPSNPGKVTALSDLTKSSVKVALCQPAVPCGTAATKVLAKQKLTTKPVTLEADVKSVLTKVSLGEVDAGLVYVTDVEAAGSKVKGITIPADQNTTTKYPIAVVKDGPQAAAAKDFQAYVTSDAGEKVLASHGFARP